MASGTRLEAERPIKGERPQNFVWAWETAVRKGTGGGVQRQLLKEELTGLMLTGSKGAVKARVRDDTAF